MQTTYFACRNRNCEKHGNVFEDGDPLHVDCAREAVELTSDEHGTPKRNWAKVAVPVALAGVAAGATLLAMRRR